MKWFILMWGFKSAGGVKIRMKQRSQRREEGIKEKGAGAQVRVRVGSEVE